jgi:acetoacetyl-CoA synthetase
MTDMPLWTPSQEAVRNAPMTKFMTEANSHFGLNLATYDDLHAWSVDRREDFWTLIWDFCGVIGERGALVLADGDKMPGAAFFPDATLNFAENFLRLDGDSDALVFKGEDKVSYRLSWSQLRAQVSQMQQALRAAGVKAGDRVAAMMPNMPETVVCMLAPPRLAQSGLHVRPISANRACSTVSVRSSPSYSSSLTAIGTTANRTTSPAR